jgi:hypothetical protein
MVESFSEDVKRDQVLAFEAQQAGFDLPIPIDPASVERLAPKRGLFLQAKRKKLYDVMRDLRLQTKDGR